jgi:hypothetical protein
MLPAFVAEEAFIDIAGVVPPEDTIGAVPVTDETIVGLLVKSL